MIYPFSKIVFDCKQATLLSIKKDEGKISFVERIKLSYHLLYCDPCRRFIEQWDRLQKVEKPEDKLSLSSDARERIGKKINETL